MHIVSSFPECSGSTVWGVTLVAEVGRAYTLPGPTVATPLDKGRECDRNVDPDTTLPPFKVIFNKVHTRNCSFI